MTDIFEIAYVSARGKWHEFTGPTIGDYRAHVQRLGTQVADLEKYGSDLYLALACGRAETGALRALERYYFPALDIQLARLGFDETAREDVFQQVHLHLCAGSTPRILTYAGRASLASWLGVATLRFALNMANKAKSGQYVRTDITLDSLVSASASPEVRVAIEKARPFFQSALQAALGALPERDRTLLRMCFVDGLSIDDIGSIYGVHRATAARWIANIREGILKSVQGVIAQEFGLHTTEFDSLVFLIRSELHLSLRRVLGAA